MIKNLIKKTISAFNPHFEKWWWDTQYFKSLGRKPPELIWQPLEPSPQEKMDSGGIQVGSKLYVFGGFRTIEDVLSDVHILDLQKNRWIGKVAMPSDMAQSHLGMVGDGARYIYAVSGQLGNQCHPSTSNCFVFDTFDLLWNKFPPLPKARYAPAVQLWKGRLHVMGGSAEDRNTPAVDHWSIAVKDGKAVEKTWKAEISIPRGGPHRACCVIGDKLYLFGGQEGDYVPDPGDPKFTCNGNLSNEHVYADTYMLEYGSNGWKRLADMPVKNSHIEFSTVVIGNKVVIIGGMHYKDPQTKVIKLSDAVQIYDTSTDIWVVAGRLPYRIKSALAAYHNDWLYMTTGQRDRGPQDPTPGHYDDRLWRAKFSIDR
jgi:hypothetical protein